VLLDGRPAEPGVLPQPLGNRDRVDAGGLPPCRLVAVAVKGAVVGAAERHGELVADPAPQGPRLHEPQMMRVRRAPSADKAGLCSNELELRTVAVTAGFAQGERALIDVMCQETASFNRSSPCAVAPAGLTPTSTTAGFGAADGTCPRGRRLRIPTAAGVSLGRAASFAVLSSTLARSAANSATRPGVSAGSASFASPRPAAEDEGRGASAEQ
jgi:hypothetical protein